MIDHLADWGLRPIRLDLVKNLLVLTTYRNTRWRRLANRALQAGRRPNAARVPPHAAIVW
jgi:hypothetical protein